MAERVNNEINAKADDALDDDPRCRDQIRLVHYTAQEYLRRTQEQWLPEAHDTITKVCTTYLSYEKFELSCPNLGTAREYNHGWFDSFSRLIIQLCGHHAQSDNLYKFAIHRWGIHARLARNSHRQVMNFLNRPVNVDASAFGISDTPNLWELLVHHASESRSGPEVGSETGDLDHQCATVTALHLAAYFGLETAASEIIQQVSDMDIRFKIFPEKTALMLAAGQGHKAIVRLLLGNCAMVSLVCKSDHTALWYAAKRGSESIVDFLLKNGASKEVTISYTCLPHSRSLYVTFNTVLIALANTRLVLGRLR